MTIEEILTVDSGRRPAKRLGRGAGSGQGKTSGRGQKGEGARSGGTNRGPTFEGGQFPFWMRLPKRGFSNARHTTRYQAVSLAKALERIDGDIIDIAGLIAAGLADDADRIKLVGGAAVPRAITVSVHRVTTSVREAITAAGGSVEERDA